MAEQQLTEEQRRELEEKLKNMSPEELREFQKQQCVFCQIIAGKIPSKMVFDDEQCVAVLDINPASPGHLLLLPKEHYAIMPQVPEELLNHLTIISKKLSQILLRALKRNFPVVLSLFLAHMLQLCMRVLCGSLPLLIV